MRKIAASYIMPVSSPPLRNGMLVMEDDGRILEVIDTGGCPGESSRLEFYPGILTPGFVLPWYRAEGQADTLSEKGFRDVDRRLLQQGIKGIGIVERRAGHFAEKKQSGITYHTILELCPARDQDEFEVYQQGIDLISEAWNEFQLACSVSCCTSSLMNTDLLKYILQYAVAHQQVIPLENSGRWPLPEQLARLKQHLERVSEEPPGGLKSNAHLLLVHDPPEPPVNSDSELEGVLPTFHSVRPAKDASVLKAMYALQEASPQRSLPDVLPAYTLTAAEAIFEEDTLGSIEAGKIPGLNLLSNVEPDTFRLSRQSTIRVLA